MPVSTLPEVPRHPALLPGLRRLWRDPAALQLGRAPGRAWVLCGIDEQLRRVLTLLDGTRDVEQVIAEARRVGCSGDRTGQLLEALARRGLLGEGPGGAAGLPPLPLAERDRLAPDVAALALVTAGRPQAVLTRRATARVAVHGAGRVGALLAALLASAGLGGVDVVDDATARPADLLPGGVLPRDLGRRRGEAVRDRLHELAPSVRTGPDATPDLVVLAPVGPLDEPLVRGLARRRVPHLLAEVRSDVGVVGPLVLPGRSCCLSCLDLQRTDRDPDWPALAAQLAHGRPAAEACDVLLAAAVAVQGAMQVVAALDQLERPAALGGTLELIPPDHRWRRRSWTVHPDCACRRHAA